MINHRAAPANRVNHSAPYPANNLYVLAVKQDTIVAQLVALRKKWRAHEVSIYDHNTEHEVGCPCGAVLQVSLQDDALSAEGEMWQDAVVLSYWWYHDTFPGYGEDNGSSHAGSVLATSSQPTQLTLSLDIAIS